MTKASPLIYDVHVFSAVEHANRHRILLLVDKEDSRLPESITIFIFSFFFLSFRSARKGLCCESIWCDLIMNGWKIERIHLFLRKYSSVISGSGWSTRTCRKNW